MKFNLRVRISNPRKGIREELINLIGQHLKRSGYVFDVGFAVNDYELEESELPNANA